MADNSVSAAYYDFKVNLCKSFENNGKRLVNKINRHFLQQTTAMSHQGRSDSIDAGSRRYSMRTSEYGELKPRSECGLKTAIFFLLFRFLRTSHFSE